MCAGWDAMRFAVILLGATTRMNVCALQKCALTAYHRMLLPAEHCHRKHGRGTASMGEDMLARLVHAVSTTLYVSMQPHSRSRGAAQSTMRPSSEFAPPACSTY